MEPVSYATVREYHEGGFSFTGWCPECLHSYPLSLERLVAKGKGDKLLRNVRVRHGCGATLQTQISPRDFRLPDAPIARGAKAEGHEVGIQPAQGDAHGDPEDHSA